MSASAIRLTLASCLVLASTGLVRAEDPPPGLRGAARQINTEKKVIMAFMYPTVTLDDIEFDGYRRTDAGFELDVIFDYSDKGDNSGWVKASFGFDKAGKLTSVNVRKWSDFFPPFGLAKLTLELIKGAIRNDANATADAKKLLTIDDPKVFLVEYLKTKDR
jgi:hypothetical protein